MTTAVQRRRGTNTEHASFTGLEGELSVNTTNESVHVHDGSTAGGFELARADASNIVATSIDINGGTIDGTTIGASSASTGAFTTLTASGTFTASPSGGVATLGANGHITSKQSLDVATAGGRYIGSSNRGILGQLRIEQATTGADGGYIDFDTCANGSTSPTNRMRIDSSGNIKFGATGNGYISGTAPNTYNSGYSQDSDSWSTWMNYNGYQDGASRYRDFIVGNGKQGRIATFDGSSGNVGIGTTAIMQDFGGGRTTLALKGTGSADYSTLQLGNYGTTSNGQIHGLINFYDGTTSVSRIQSVRASNTSDAHLTFYTAPSSGGITERMRITDSGVGIGRTPRVALDVAGEVAIPFDTNYGLRFYNQPQNNWSSIGCNETSSAANLVFKDSTGEAMRITSGNLLVGTTATDPAGNNTAGMSVGTGGGLSVQGTNTALVIGVPSAQTYGVAFRFQGNLAGRIGIEANNITVADVSDYRLKENVSPLSDALTKIKALKPSSFNFINYPDKTHEGFIAHELQEVIPYAVSGEKDALITETTKDRGTVGEIDPQAVDLRKLVPTLVAAIQEQQTLIESLTARIASLEE